MFDLMDERYSAKDDESIIRFDDIRKTKLTLEQKEKFVREYLVYIRDSGQKNPTVIGTVAVSFPP